MTVTSASANGALGRMHSARNDSLQVVRDTPRFTGKPLPLGHAFRWAGPTDANRSGVSSYGANDLVLSVPKCAQNRPPLAVTNGGRFWPASQRPNLERVAAPGGINSQSNDVFTTSFSLTKMIIKRNRLAHA
jgi:hypothetical protein